jgi:hypothetical protein
MRAWLEILRQRHPEVSWVSAEKHDRALPQTAKREMEAMATPASANH